MVTPKALPPPFPFDQSTLEATGYSLQAKPIGFLTQFWNILVRKYTLGPCSQTLRDVFPILTVFKNGYTLHDATRDFISGLTLSVVLIPQALAYAPLAGLKPQYGLYSSFAATIMYLFFGTTRELSIGPFALVSIIIGQAIADMYPNLPDTNSIDYDAQYSYRLTYTLALGFCIGIWLFVMALFKLGWLIDFTSKPAIRGLIMASELTVCASQIGSLFGVTTVRGSCLEVFISFIKNIATINPYTVVLGIISLTILCIADWYNKYKKFKIPIPAQIIVVIITTALSAIFQMHEKWGMKVVGGIEMGFPAPKMVQFSLLSNGEYWSNGFLAAIVVFVISSSVSQAMSDQHGYPVNFNSELLALGTCGTVGAFFNSYVSSASLSRTTLVNSTNPATRLWNLTTLCVILFVICLIAPLLHNLPKCVLAAVVISSFRSQFANCFQGVKIWKQSPTDGFVHFITLFSTLFISVQAGLVAAFVGSIISVSLTSSMYQPQMLRLVPTTQRFIPSQQLPPTLFSQFIEQCYMKGGQLPSQMRHLQTFSADFAVPGHYTVIDDTNASSDYHTVDDNDDDYDDQRNISSDIIDPDDDTNINNTVNINATTTSKFTRLPLGIIPKCPTIVEDPRIVVLHVGDQVSFLNQIPFFDYLNQLVTQQDAFIRYHGTKYNSIYQNIIKSPSARELIDKLSPLFPQFFSQSSSSTTSTSLPSTTSTLESLDRPYNYNLQATNSNILIPFDNIIPQNQYCAPQNKNQELATFPLSNLQQHQILSMLSHLLSKTTITTYNQWRYVYILDSVMNIDYTAQLSLKQFYANHPDVLLLWTNPSLTTLKVLQKDETLPPMNDVFDSVYNAYIFSQLLLNTSAKGRIIDNTNLQADVTSELTANTTAQYNDDSVIALSQLPKTMGKMISNELNSDYQQIGIENASEHQYAINDDDDSNDNDNDDLKEVY